MKLSAGDVAPHFSVHDQVGNIHSKDEYQGQWYLIYFYPKDNTLGCTKEACAFRDLYSELKKQLIILGVSGDSQKSHQSFTEKYQLPFPLLADSDKDMIKAYGADGAIFNKRVSFLINPEGKIEKIYTHVKPVEHPIQVLKDIQQIRAC